MRLEIAIEKRARGTGILWIIISIIIIAGKKYSTKLNKYENLHLTIQSSDPEKINIATRHFQMLKEYYCDRVSINLSKKHFNYYFKGFEGASLWRKIFMQIKTSDEINDVMQKMKQALIP